MKQEEGKRITIRLNSKDLAELELLKRRHRIDGDSEALKLGVEWVNTYLNNVTRVFFPATYDVVLMKKLKSRKVERKVWD